MWIAKVDDKDGFGMEVRVFILLAFILFVTDAGK
jgi:hypothetical protein